MKKKIMKKWVKALRSGEFKQTTDSLENTDGNCCLGVLCNLALVEGVCDYSEKENYLPAEGFFDNECNALPESVRKWSGMKSKEGPFGPDHLLIYLNDVQGLNFNQIADIIEARYKEL